MSSYAFPFAINPSSIAVIGASDNPTSLGFHLWKNAITTPSKIKFWAVNPKYKTLSGLPCFAKIEDIPTHVDLAVIALKSEKIIPLFKSIAAKKIPYVFIPILEKNLEQEPKLIQQIQALGKKHNIRIIGPGSMGLLIPSVGLNLSEALPLPASGNIAFIGQSSLFSSACLDAFIYQQMGVSFFVNTAEESDLALEDFIETVALDPRTEVIALEVAALKNINACYSHLLLASQSKKVVLFNTSKSNEAIRISSYKQGNPIDSNKSFEALLRRTGSLLIDDFDLFISTIAALSHNKIPQTNRLGIISNSSGFAALASDIALEAGLSLPIFSSRLTRTLSEETLSLELLTNPLNLGIHASEERLQLALQAFLSENKIDMLMTIMAPNILQDVRATFEKLETIAQNSHKPVVFSWISANQNDLVRQCIHTHLKDRSLIAIRSPQLAIETLGKISEFQQLQNLRKIPPRFLNPIITVDQIEKAKTIIKKAIKEKRYTLEAHEIYDILEIFHLLHISTEFASTFSDLKEKVNAIGFPVALKIVAKGVVNKRSVGGVFLGISDESALQKAWDSLKSNLRQFSPYSEFRGALIQPFVVSKTERELVICTRQDSLLGAVISVNLHTENHTYAHDVLPLDGTSAQHLLDCAIPNKTDFFDGEGQISDQDLLKVLLTISGIQSHIPEIESFTLSPIINIDGKPVALDARIRLKPKSKTNLAIQPPPLDRIMLPKLGLTLRAIQDSDYLALQRFITRLSSSSIEKRFHSSRAPTNETILNLCRVDYARESVWIIEDDHEIHAIARWTQTNTPDDAEFGIVVEDSYQRKGLARILMSHLEKTAQKAKIRRLVGLVLKNNDAMHSFLTRLNYVAQPSKSASSTQVWQKNLFY